MIPFKIDKPINYPSKANLKQQVWCIKNDIIPYCTPISNTECYISVNFKGTIIKGTQVFKTFGLRPKDINWSGVVWALYEGYYKYYNDKLNSNKL